MKKTRCGAIIVAAGSSSRMSGQDKIFLDIAGKPTIAWAVERAENAQAIDEIVIVLSEKNVEEGRQLLRREKWKKVRSVCTGGKRRQDSVSIGLKKLQDCEFVMVHDGARPCVTEQIIKSGFLEAFGSGVAIAGVPVIDTVHRVGHNLEVANTFLRQGLWIAQTPQIFRYEILAEAHQRVKEDMSDDSSMVKRVGYKVRCIWVSYNNIKITTPYDVIMANTILSTMH